MSDPILNPNSLLQKRFILCMIVVLGSFGLRFGNLLTDPGFVQVIIWVTGIFVAGDVGSNWVDGLFSKATTVKPS